MDAIVLLKNDHRTVEKLFKEFEKSHKADARPDAKKRIVDQVIKELTTHAYIEETIFYPVARKAVPETAEHVLESVEEHHVVAWMLSELMNLDPSDERYDAKMTVLIENVRHHVEEEEQDWFPEVRKGLGRKRLQELAEQMEAAKADAPSDPLALASASA
jgi:hemerythrin superfamily protein